MEVRLKRPPSPEQHERQVKRPRVSFHGQLQIKDWPTDKSVTSAGGLSVNGLCRKCEALGFNEEPGVLAHRVRRIGGEVIGVLGSLDEVWFEKSCAFCRLMVEILQLFPQEGCARADAKLLIRAHQSKREHSWHTYRSDNASERRTFLSIGLEGNRVREERCFISTIGASTDQQPWKAVTSQVRVIAEESIDWSLLRKWTAHCHTKHPSPCMRSDTAPAVSIRLIDVAQRAIASADTSWQYAALSYVWGGKNDIINQAGPIVLSLPEGLPRTIEDALTATEKLGIKYLWIDRYCINQADVGERHHQIANMDRIYQQSLVTLVAAAGSDPSYGLPGVSSTKRVHQPRCFVGDKMLVSLMSNPKKPIKQSAWNTRGWTYQEAVCSTRCLFFTDQQVTFECSQGIQCETIDYTAPKMGPLFHTGHFGRRALPFMRHVSNYTKRDLTFDSDALNGMLGILRRLNSTAESSIAQSSIVHFWGIPVITQTRLNRRMTKTDPGAEPPVTDVQIGSSSQGFFHGLAWRSLTEGRRRRMFPSWSWAGWTCEVDKSSHTHKGEDKYGEEESPLIVVQDGSGARYDFEQAMALYSDAQSTPQAPPLLAIVCLTLELGIDIKSTKEPQTWGVHPLSRPEMAITEGLTWQEALKEGHQREIHSWYRGIVMSRPPKPSDTHSVMVMLTRFVKCHGSTWLFERVGHFDIPSGQQARLWLGFARTKSIALA